MESGSEFSSSCDFLKVKVVFVSWMDSGLEVLCPHPRLSEARTTHTQHCLTDGIFPHSQALPG